MNLRSEKLPLSVIIPTFNRFQSVSRTIDSLARQSLSPRNFEVTVVDDGSRDETETLASKQFPFKLRYLKQKNQGATLARNFGACQSDGDNFVFIDDDVSLTPDVLVAMLETLSKSHRTLVMGRLIPRCPDRTSVFGRVQLSGMKMELMDVSVRPIHFTGCNTELVGLRSQEFFTLGMLQDPTGGWPNWDDVDFGYRAHLHGFSIVQDGRAVGEHWDHALNSLETCCARSHRASKAAVRLFQRHPGLLSSIPMFRDSTPIRWSKDGAGLTTRKLIRRPTSSKLALQAMSQVASLLELHYPSPKLLRPLYRWIVGGYIFRGFQEGMREYGSVTTGVGEER